MKSEEIKSKFKHVTDEVESSASQLELRSEDESCYRARRHREKVQRCRKLERAFFISSPEKIDLVFLNAVVVQSSLFLIPKRKRWESLV